MVRTTDSDDEDSLINRILEYASRFPDLFDRHEPPSNDVDEQNIDDQRNNLYLEEIKEEDAELERIIQKNFEQSDEKNCSSEESKITKIDEVQCESEKTSELNQQCLAEAEKTSKSEKKISDQYCDDLRIDEEETSYEQDFNLDQNVMDIASTSQLENIVSSVDDCPPVPIPISSQSCSVNDMSSTIMEEKIELEMHENSQQFTEIDLNESVKKVMDEQGFEVTYVLCMLDDFDGEHVEFHHSRIKKSDLPANINPNALIFENEYRKKRIVIFLKTGEKFQTRENYENREISKEKWIVHLVFKYKEPGKKETVNQTDKHKLPRKFSLNSLNQHHAHVKKLKFMRTYSLRDIVEKRILRSNSQGEETQNKDQTDGADGADGDSSNKSKDKKLTQTFSFDDFSGYRGAIRKLSLKAKNKEVKSTESSAQKPERPLPANKPKRSKKVNTPSGSITDEQGKSNDDSKDDEQEFVKDNAEVIEQGQKQKPQVVRKKQKPGQSAELSSEMPTTEQSTQVDCSSSKTDAKPMSPRRNPCKSAIGRGLSRARNSIRARVGSDNPNQQRDRQDGNGQTVTADASKKQDLQNGFSATDKKRRKWFSKKRWRKNIGKVGTQAQKVLHGKSSHNSSSQPSCSRDVHDGKHDRVKQRIIQINIPESLSMQNDKRPITFTIAFNSESGAQNLSLTNKELQDLEKPLTSVTENKENNSGQENEKNASLEANAEI